MQLREIRRSQEDTEKETRETVTAKGALRLIVCSNLRFSDGARHLYGLFSNGEKPCVWYGATTWTFFMAFY